MLDTSYHSSLNIIHNIPDKNKDDQLNRVGNQVYKCFLYPLLNGDLDRVHGNMMLLSEKIYHDLKKSLDKREASRIMMLLKLVEKFLELENMSPQNRMGEAKGEGSIATLAVNMFVLKLKPEYELYNLLFRGYGGDDQERLQNTKDETIKYLRSFLRHQNLDYKKLRKEIDVR